MAPVEGSGLGLGSRFHLGTMGWSYPHWVGNLYPAGTRSEGFLREYSRHFDTVEVDSSFYRIPSRGVVEVWRDETGEDFIFSAKFPKSITHEGVLGEAPEKVAVFLKNMRALGGKLGPLLLQFPPGFGPDEMGRLRDFLAGLPEGLRYAVEIRDRRWLGEGFYSLLTGPGCGFGTG